jgi:hypothetical protein
MNRRDWFRYGTLGLKSLIALALAVPGAAYLLSPLLKRRQDDSEFRRLARLGDLVVGQPRSFSIVEEQQDAWVTYPATPVGTVWLVRQPEGADQPVLALSAECPHLACKIKQTGDSLEVEPIDPTDPDAEIRVKFQRFRTGTEEKIPLA